MDDDSSNDIVAMENAPGTSQSETSKARPIIQFLRRLVVNNSSQNTVLTNVQLEDILANEFNYDLSKLHELEIEIYINVLKKFLKDWPKWDEFDRTIKDTAMGDEEALNRILETRYENLKKFLKTNLDSVQDLSEEWVTKARNALKETLKPSEEESKSGVVLEIAASREQLSKLIYRHPHPMHNLTIFNAKNIAPSQIRLNTLSLEAILNWWSVRITLSLQWSQNTTAVFIKRETTHKSDFLLINKKIRKQYKNVEPLNDKIQIQEPKNALCIETSDIIGSLDLLSKLEPEYTIDGIDVIIACLKKDIEKLPYCLAPASYRRCLSKYPYIRYLYTDVPDARKSDKSKYDIQLKETLEPMHMFSIGRVEGQMDTNLPSQWLKVECVACGVSFANSNLLIELRQHFNEQHQVEGDWQCAGCRRSFSMQHLAESWWMHHCKVLTGHKEYGRKERS